MLRLAIVLGLVTGVLASIPTALAAAPPRLVGKCATATVRPTGVILTCGDANSYITHVRWQDWGSAVAVGTGTLAVNPCTPNCASTPSSKFARASVVVLASRPVSCSGGFRAYTRVAYAFPQNGPVPAKALRSTDASTPFGCAGP